MYSFGLVSKRLVGIISNHQPKVTIPIQKIIPETKNAAEEKSLSEFVKL
jgi:hypothetical protein